MLCEMYLDFIDLSKSDVKRLAASILLQAVNDWITLIHEESHCAVKTSLKGRKRSINYDEIEIFLESDYAKMLGDYLHIEAASILEELLSKRRLFRETGALPSLIGKNIVGQEIKREKESQLCLM